MKTSKTESNWHLQPFGDIVKATINDCSMLSTHNDEKDSITRRKRAILQAKRNFPLESVADLCKRVGIEEVKTFVDWCGEDKDFGQAYSVISNLINDYLMDLYGKYRITKQLN